MGTTSLTGRLETIDRVLSEQQVCEILNISKYTLKRLNDRGEGPTRRRYSPKRIGFRLSEVEAYVRGEPLPVPKSQKRKNGRGRHA